MPEIKDMSTDELEARKNEILNSLDNEDADLDALEEEARAIREELEARKAAEAKKVELRKEVAEMAAEPIEESPIEEERKKMENKEEVRNSKEYIDAYAQYIKTENDSECRALLSGNASGGSVPVPELVYDIVRTAWNKEGIMSRVRKAYIKGNLKVGFEISSTEAATHLEGVAVDEETLVLGTVELVPQSIKKWISISDEALDLAGEAFLRYIYDELAYRIAKKAADILVGKIKSAGTASTTTAVGVPVITAQSASLGLVAQAVSQLSDEASSPVILMNKLTWSAFKTAQYSANFAADPFEGLPVEFNDKIAAVSAASTGDTWLIVADLDKGALANFPAGEEIKFKFDDTTLATQDLVRVIGREFVAIELVGPGAIVKVNK